MPFVPSRARKNNISKVNIPYAGEQLAIWYRPDAITPARLEEMSAETAAVSAAAAAAKAAGDEAAQPESDNQLTSMILEFVSDWDVAEPVMNGRVDDEGNVMQATDVDGNLMWEKWPLDRAHLRQLSVPAQLAIVDGIVKDFQPGEKTASGSFTG